MRMLVDGHPLSSRSAIFALRFAFRPVRFNWDLGIELLLFGRVWRFPPTAASGLVVDFAVSS